MAKKDVKIDFFVTKNFICFLFSLPQMWTGALSLKGKRLDFYGRADTYVSLTNTIPELSRFTVCVDLRFVGARSI